MDPIEKNKQFLADVKQCRELLKKLITDIDHRDTLIGTYDVQPFLDNDTRNLMVRVNVAMKSYIKQEEDRQIEQDKESFDTCYGQHPGTCEECWEVRKAGL